MPKAEISWKRLDEAGEKLQVTAQRVGREWIFSARHRRFDRWITQEEPPLEDWLELLDALRRLMNRRRFMPEEIEHVEDMIRERFPEAEF